MTFRVAVGCDGCRRGVVAGDPAIQFVELVRDLEATSGWTARRFGGSWHNYCRDCSIPIDKQQIDGDRRSNV